MPSDDFNLPQSPRTTVILSWLAWILFLVATAAGGIAPFVPVAYLPYALGGSAVLFGLSSEIRRRLPSAERIAAIDPPAGPTVAP